MTTALLAVVRTWSVPILLFGVSLSLATWLVRPDKLPEAWRQVADIGTLAIPMTAIILTGGIDLSVGSIVALSGIVLGLLYRDFHWPIWMAAGGCVLAGALLGGFNGGLVAIGVAPLVATLATMALYAGLAMALVNGERIKDLPDSFTWIGQKSLQGLPYSVWLLILLAVLYYVLVHHTWIGRTLFAIGENRLAAEFAAIPVRRIEALLYVLSGTAAGLVAVIETGWRASAIPDAAGGFELQAIACVVLGGTRVTGGFGSIGRTLLGLATLAHLQIGLRNLGYTQLVLPGLEWHMSFDANAQKIVIGLLVIAVAVANERLTSRRR